MFSFFLSPCLSLSHYLSLSFISTLSSFSTSLPNSLCFLSVFPSLSHSLSFFFSLSVSQFLSHSSHLSLLSLSLSLSLFPLSLCFPNVLLGLPCYSRLSWSDIWTNKDSASPGELFLTPIEKKYCGVFMELNCNVLLQMKDCYYLNFNRRNSNFPTQPAFLILAPLWLRD